MGLRQPVVLRKCHIAACLAFGSVISRPKLPCAPLTLRVKLHPLMPPPTPGYPAELLALLPAVVSLPRIATMQVFLLPGDPLPQAITRLTGLELADIKRLFEKLGTEEPARLEQVLRNEPEATYYFLLVGWLALDSPLGAGIAAQLHEMPADVQTQLLDLMAQMLEKVLLLLALSLPDPVATAATAEALRAVFAQEKYGLSGSGFDHPPATAEADEVWLTMRPTALELQVFGMALRLAVGARFGVPHPLGQALATTEVLGNDHQMRLLSLRFKTAQPDTPLDVNGPDLLRLYLSLHVLTLLLLADLHPALMDRLEPEARTDAPWHDPKQQQQMVAWVGSHVEAFSQICDEEFGDEPAYLAAQAEVQRLAALL